MAIYRTGRNRFFRCSLPDLGTMPGPPRFAPREHRAAPPICSRAHCQIIPCSGMLPACLSTTYGVLQACWPDFSPLCPHRAHPPPRTGRTSVDPNPFGQARPRALLMEARCRTARPALTAYDPRTTLLIRRDIDVSEGGRTGLVFLPKARALREIISNLSIDNSWKWRTFTGERVLIVTNESESHKLIRQ